MKNQNSPLVKLTTQQVEKLAAFAKEEGQSDYIITHGVIPSFEDDGGNVVPEYSGLIAYSQSEQHGVLQLD